MFYKSSLPYILAIVMVISSMAIAVIFHQLNGPRIVTDKLNENSVAAASAWAEVDIPKEVRKCECTTDKVVGPNFDERLRPLRKGECSSEAAIHLEAQNRIPIIFRKQRTAKRAEFPRLCVVFLLRDLLSEQKKTCVTDELVNSVFHTIIDLSDCLDIPQKNLLVWLHTQRAFVQNQKFEGLNYLDVSETGLTQVRHALKDSAEASCQRLALLENSSVMKPWLDLAQEMSFEINDKAGRAPTAETDVLRLNLMQQILHPAEYGDSLNRFREFFKPGICTPEINFE